MYNSNRVMMHHASCRTCHTRARCEVCNALAHGTVRIRCGRIITLAREGDSSAGCCASAHHLSGHAANTWEGSRDGEVAAERAMGRGAARVFPASGFCERDCALRKRKLGHIFVEQGAQRHPRVGIRHEHGKRAWASVCAVDRGPGPRRAAASLARGWSSSLHVQLELGGPRGGEGRAELGGVAQPKSPAADSHRPAIARNA